MSEPVQVAVTVYFTLRGESVEELDQLVYRFCQEFKARYPDKIVEVHGETGK